MIIAVLTEFLGGEGKSLKRLLAVILSVLILPVFAGCSGNKASIIRYDLPGDPRSLDPQTASDQASHIIINGIFEGFFKIDGTGTLQNALATSYQLSEDGMHYSFALREDAKWTYLLDNGTLEEVPVTAHDFVFAFRRLFLANTNAAAASRFFCIQNSQAVLRGEKKPEELGVTAKGDYRLDFTLSSPNDGFLRLLATTYAMPCNEEFFAHTMGRYGLVGETRCV